MYAINMSICNVFLRKRVFKLPFDNYCKFWQLYILRHYLSNNVIVTSIWFYFLSNALCYIQIKFRDHKLIGLGTTVENIHLKIKKIYKILHFIVLLMMSSKNKLKLFHESRVQVLIFRLSLESTFYGKHKYYFCWHKNLYMDKKNHIFFFRESPWDKHFCWEQQNSLIGGYGDSKNVDLKNTLWKCS